MNPFCKKALRLYILSETSPYNNVLIRISNKTQNLEKFHGVAKLVLDKVLKNQMLVEASARKSLM
jgi:hypothetical protein